MMQKARLFLFAVVVGFALAGVWSVYNVGRQMVSDLVWLHSLRIQVEAQQRQAQQRQQQAPAQAPAPAEPKP